MIKIQSKYPELTQQQKEKAAAMLPNSIDRLGRWHCPSGHVMRKEWNEEAEQWEWFCIAEDCYESFDASMLTEIGIIEAYNEYQRTHDYGKELILLK